MIRRSRSISTCPSSSAAAMSRTSCCSMVASVGRLSSAIRMSGGYRSGGSLYIENRPQPAIISRRVCTGARHSRPSSSIDNCAGVSVTETVPSACGCVAGQVNAP